MDGVDSQQGLGSNNKARAPPAALQPLLCTAHSRLHKQPHQQQPTATSTQHQHSAAPAIHARTFSKMRHRRWYFSCSEGKSKICVMRWLALRSAEPINTW